MVDILIRFPGASPTEVENLVVINLEKKLWEMEGLEDLYSQARDGFAIVTAKFRVGENLETSLFKVYNKVFSNIDQVPSGRDGLGGQAHERQRRAHRHPDPVQQRRRRLRAAGGWRTNCSTASRAFPTRAAPMWWRAASARCGWWPTRPAWPATAWIWPRWPRPSRSATSICRRAISPARTGNTWWRPGRFLSPPMRSPTSWWGSTRASRSISRTWPRSSTGRKSRWNSAPSPSGRRKNCPRATSGASFIPR